MAAPTENAFLTIMPMQHLDMENVGARIARPQMQSVITNLLPNIRSHWLNGRRDSIMLSQ